ncbi:MAG: metalloprotease PmbA [bacterium]
MDLREQEHKLTALVQDILAEARQQGADQAEVSVSVDSGLSVSVRKGELENVEFNQDRGFGITLYYGQRKGSASTTDSSHRAIADTVAAARNIASHTEDDPCNGLAEAELSPTELQDLDLFHPWEVTPQQAAELAIECEAAGLAVDARLTNSDGAQVNTQQSLRLYGNSHGFIGAYSGTRHGLSCVVIGEDENGMQRDYWYTVARNASELDAAETVGRLAGERTVARLSPRNAPTGSYPVMFAPNMASGLFGHLIGAISGGALYRRASFLLDSMGQQVLPQWLSLTERPHLRNSLGSANFDGDGVATRSKSFVTDGMVSSYVLSCYSARKLKLATTGNAGGVYNLDVDGPQTPLPDLFKQMGTGLLVTELMGQGINGVTGDYSRGAAGFWVENGEIAYPVAEVTVAGNLKDIYLAIVGIGDDVDYRGNVRAPSVLVGSMTLAGSA